MLMPPKDVIELDNLMSNCFYEIDQNVAEQLKSGDAVARYPAWDFYGTVWWQDGQYHCQVMRFGQHVATISAPTPKELMHDCSDRFGWK